MVRGLFTASSGMLAQLNKISIVANNLANVYTTAYKREEGILKAFPQILARRINDDGVVTFPLGSYDVAPVIGRIGTGVELNEIYTVFEQGVLRETGNEFDLALEGEGFFVVETPYGKLLTRNGSFKIDKDGFLVTKEGYKVLGEKGYIKVKSGNFKVDEQGNIWMNMKYDEEDPTQFVSASHNQWEEQEIYDRLLIVNVRHPRYLEKFGMSYYKTTEISGDFFVLNGETRPKVHQGFLETANVNPVVEMVKLIEIERLYEANSKVVQTEDQLLGRVVNEVGRGPAV